MYLSIFESRVHVSSFLLFMCLKSRECAELFQDLKRDLFVLQQRFLFLHRVWAHFIMGMAASWVWYKWHLLSAMSWPMSWQRLVLYDSHINDCCRFDCRFSGCPTGHKRPPPALHMLYRVNCVRRDWNVMVMMSFPWRKEQRYNTKFPLCASLALWQAEIEQMDGLEEWTKCLNQATYGFYVL